MPRTRSTKQATGASGGSVHDHDSKTRAAFDFDANMNNLDNDPLSFGNLDGSEMGFTLVDSML